MKRSAIKKGAPKKPSGEDAKYLAACKGQNCYLRIPGVCRNDVESVVPAHSNQSKHGKGLGLKARHMFTIPACYFCHAELDQGHKFSREEKFQMWDDAYSLWEVDRGIAES